jgi:hypothetical protein
MNESISLAIPVVRFFGSDVIDRIDSPNAFFREKIIIIIIIIIMIMNASKK